jgi:hypothetical protein
LEGQVEEYKALAEQLEKEGSAASQQLRKVEENAAHALAKAHHKEKAIAAKLKEGWFLFGVSDLSFAEN